MELKEGKKHTGGLRRPFGVAGEQLFKSPNICLSNTKSIQEKMPLLSGGVVA